MQPDGQAGPADLVQQGAEGVEAGLGHQVDVVLVAAHGGQEPAHLGQRRAPGLLDAAERVTVLGERVGELVPDRANLKHHHADGVGDDVDHHDHEALGALDHADGRGVGIARYVRDAADPQVRREPGALQYEIMLGSEGTGE
jgi:hypothetical protein